MEKLSEKIARKFTEVIDADDWLVDTDTGWQPIEDTKQTIPYEIYELVLENGTILKCADNHIVFDIDMNEVFVKDLRPLMSVNTKFGMSRVVSVTPTGTWSEMYDLGVDSVDHRYYTDGILSHNTTTAAGYLLWVAMFNPDQTILVAAHKYLGAQEIMQRVRYAYENCPDFLRAGVITYNKGSIAFDNGSRIVAQTTTENTGRGMSISLLYCLDGESTVKIRNKQTLHEEDITLRELYHRLYSPQNILT